MVQRQAAVVQRQAAVAQRQAGQWYKGRLGSGTKAGRQAAVVQRQAGRQQWYKGRQAGSSGTRPVLSGFVLSYSF